MRRWWLVGSVLLLTVLGIVAGAAVPLQLASGAVQAQQQSDPATLRDLAQRLLAPPVFGPNGQPQTVELFVGQLPSDFPLALPTPPNGRLVGSDAHRAGTQPISWAVVFDAPGAPGDVNTFYQQQLPGLGWTPAPSHPGAQRGGFQPTLNTIPLIFCQSSSGPSLTVTATVRPNLPTDVRVSVSASAGPCASSPGSPGQPPGADRLPALTAPAGVQVQTTSGGGGPNRFTSDATAITDQSVTTLEAHFAQQVQAAGWTRVAGGANGPVAWSTWTVPGDGGYEGFLYAMEAPGQNRKDLHVQVESAASQAGWIGYAPAAAATAAPARIIPTPTPTH